MKKLHSFTVSTLISLTLLVCCWFLTLLPVYQAAISADALFNFICLSAAIVGVIAFLIILHGAIAMEQIQNEMAKLTESNQEIHCSR